MIDFRYHAISLIAVLIALALGLLLGVSIGDAGLVSDFKGNIEESLNADLATAREQRDQARELNSANEAFMSEVFPALVAGELRGSRIALIGNAGATRPVLGDVRSAIEAADGRLVFTGELVTEPKLDEIAAELGIRNTDRLAKNQIAYADRVGRAVGRRIARGRAGDELRQLVFERFAGKFGRTRADVYARVPVDLADPKKRDVASAFEGGVIEGMVAARRRVSGVERLDSEPSQIKFYKSLGISTVDNIDKYAGRFALVQELAGNTTGDYGYKDTADAPIPPVSE
jgi:hypothetical protein